MSKKPILGLMILLSIFGFNSCEAGGGYISGYIYNSTDETLQNISIIFKDDKNKKLDEKIITLTSKSEESFSFDAPKDGIYHIELNYSPYVQSFNIRFDKGREVNGISGIRNNCTNNGWAGWEVYSTVTYN